MKKVVPVCLCVLGSGMMGYFANRLNTLLGSVCFTLGIVMLVCAIALLSKNKT